MSTLIFLFFTGKIYIQTIQLFLLIIDETDKFHYNKKGQIDGTRPRRYPMHILVLNGSPKGNYSITLQTIHYLEKIHPEHTFEILNVGQKVKALSQDFSPAAKAIEKADLLLFSYPVYTFIAPYQLHRFIELLKASGISLEGRFATQLSTSKHFYDVTAHRYIQDNCQDLGMKYIRGLSAIWTTCSPIKDSMMPESFFAMFAGP